MALNLGRKLRQWSGKASITTPPVISPRRRCRKKTSNEDAQRPTVPLEVEITGLTDSYSKMNGVYRLRQFANAAGHPTFAKEDNNKWLVRINDRWYVTSNQLKDSPQAGGWLTGSGARLPSLAKKWYVSDGEGGWKHQRDVQCTDPSEELRYDRDGTLKTFPQVLEAYRHQSSSAELSRYWMSLDPEKRVDPRDNVEKTFDKVVRAYGSELSLGELQRYWHDRCAPTDAPTPKVNGRIPEDERERQRDLQMKQSPGGQKRSLDSLGSQAQLEKRQLSRLGRLPGDANEQGVSTRRHRNGVMKIVKVGSMTIEVRSSNANHSEMFCHHIALLCKCRMQRGGSKKVVLAYRDSLYQKCLTLCDGSQPRSSGGKFTAKKPAAGFQYKHSRSQRDQVIEHVQAHKPDGD